MIKLGALLKLHTEGELLLQEVLNTSAIEGETLNTDEILENTLLRNKIR